MLGKCFRGRPKMFCRILFGSNRHCIRHLVPGMVGGGGSGARSSIEGYCGRQRRFDHPNGGLHHPSYQTVGRYCGLREVVHEEGLKVELDVVRSPQKKEKGAKC